MPATKKKDKKSFQVEEIPRDTRRLIFWVAMAVCAIGIVLAWIFSFQAMIAKNQTAAKDSDKTLQQLQDDLQRILTETNDGLEQLGQDLEDFLATSTATVEPTTTDATATDATTTTKIFNTTTPSSTPRLTD